MEQAYLEKLFPKGHELPNERLIPAILLQGDRTEVIFLIKVSDARGELLKNENDAHVQQSDITVHLGEVKPEGGAADLRIGLELVYPLEQVRYQGIISDDTGQKQASLAQALLKVNRIALFISSYDLRFRAFKAFDWNPASLAHLQGRLGETH